MRIVALLMVVLGLTGCSTAIAPDTVARSKNLDGDQVIFFEQSDRIPKEVLLAANSDKGSMVNAMVAIPPEVIAELIKQLFTIAPEIAKEFSKERMENSLIQRRILLKGYSGEELKDIIEIIKALNGSIEFITPQDPGKPTVKALDNPVPKKK